MLGRDTVVPLNGDLDLQPCCECREGFQHVSSGRCEPCPPDFKRSNSIPPDEFTADGKQQLLYYECFRR